MMVGQDKEHSCLGLAGCTQPRRKASAPWSFAGIHAAICKSRYLKPQQHDVHDRWQTA